MLTSFFSKSKPANTLLLVLFMLVFYSIANFYEWFVPLHLENFLVKTGALLAFVFSMLLLNFIARKNDLTKRSAYKMLLFVLFATSFFPLLQDSALLVSNLCILLALRRLLSLRSQKFIKKKIYDAALWVCIASLFHFWAILFLLPVFAAILLFAASLKNLLIPILAILTVASLTSAYTILAHQAFYGWQDWWQASNFNFENYQNLQLLVPLSIVLTVLIWTLIFFILVIRKATNSVKPSLNLIVFSLFVALGLAVLSSHKDGSELIFLFVPLSIIASNYFESKRDKIFREVLLILLTLMPLGVAFFF